MIQAIYKELSHSQGPPFEHDLVQKYEPHMADSNTVKLFSDSSKKGFGACYGSNWIQGIWPSEWKDFHINILELYPILALVETFGHKFRRMMLRLLDLKIRFVTS